MINNSDYQKARKRKENFSKKSRAVLSLYCIGQYFD